ncbi:MAG: hypothetical protein EBY20_00485, partial [Alphaproteobacteria bacterium]|nr:hypothetical protein [Alphaproteobacteria bacterium]
MSSSQSVEEVSLKPSTPEKQTIDLQLSDVVRFEAPQNKILNDKTFIIEYIDKNSIKLVNVDDLTSLRLKISADGILGDGSITSIALIDRNENSGYARQNNLLLGTWVDILFGGDAPVIITGEITNLEEDMIELKSYPEGDTLYINFGYKGLPEDLPIETITIREKPEKIRAEEKPKLSEESDETIQPIQDLEEDVAIENRETLYNLPAKDIKDTVREFFVRADEIKIGQELSAITQMIDVEENQQRYNIYSQTDDLLNELLSNIPNTQRTSSVLNNIHTMIERFKQLRVEFSNLDENGNVIGPIIKTVNWKPLATNLMSFKTLLFWLLPVAKNVKKVYNISSKEDAEDFVDIVPLSIDENIAEMKNIFDRYKSNDTPSEQNKYFNLISELNPYLTPFNETNSESTFDVINSISIANDISAIIDNLDDFSSSIVQNDIVKTKKFVIQRYNLGVNRLDATQITGKKMISHRVNITQPDVLEIKSILTLPEPAVRFSRINLPATSIYEKANLNNTFINYWQLLNDNTRVNKVAVSNLESEDEAIAKVLVYTDDLTFMQYKEMNLFLQEKISEYYKSFKEKEKEFSAIKKKAMNISLKPNDRSVVSLLTDRKNSNEVLRSYDYDQSDLTLTSSELLWKMINTDYSNIYNNALALANIGTMMPENINSIIENIEKEKNKLDEAIKEEEKDNKCINIVISKQYKTLEEIAADNDKLTYFDKKYDDTTYGILDDYQKEQIAMEPAAFNEFLIQKLISKNKIRPDDAPYMAETLITGMKRVVDGDFAILYDLAQDKLLYFKRVHNKWQPDKTIDEKTVTSNQGLLCDFQKDCMEVDKKYKSICETQDMNKRHVTENALKEIINQFDKKYDMSKEKLLELLTKNYDYDISIIEKLHNIHHSRIFKYNAEQFKLGVGNDDFEKDIVASPYVKLRDLILGQSNITNKNNYLVRFAIRFTREPNPDESTTEDGLHWRYCVKTGVKLLPSFMYKLAVCWTENPNNYMRIMDEIIKDCGKKSDDGDSWVDEYSGYIIRAIDPDIDEGYEEGYKVKTREVMEQDLG